AELGGRYLTPSRRRIQDFGTPSLSRLTTLWGTLGWMAVEAKAWGLEWEAQGIDRQALGTDRPVFPSPEDHHDYRRAWSGEIAVRREVVPWLTTEARWLYQDRSASYGPP